jgi:uncharacterized protein (UPF0276 family)
VEAQALRYCVERNETLAILLGTSWSPVAQELPDLDLLTDIVEVPGWNVDAAIDAGNTRLLLHNMDLDVSLANPSYIDDAWGARVRATIERTESLWFSLHLGFANERVRFDEHMLPESEPLCREELFARIVESVRRAKAHLHVPLLLENLDYCPEGAYEHICDPEFITGVLEETDTRLLLDLGHLQVSASWLGTTPEAMLDRLPLDRLVELHISSPRPLAGEGNNGRLDDVHEALTDREERLLREVLGRAQPRALILEYRRDPELLRNQLGQLGGIIGRRWRGRSC